MGCVGSKAEDSPLVVRCRERRELISAAVNYRFALAAAHVSYFRSLKDVGDALRKFVEEELVDEALSSSVSSPSLILPAISKIQKDNVDELRLHDNEDEVGSHLNLSDSSSDDDGDSEDHNHNNRHDHHHDSDDDHQLNERHVHEQKENDFDFEVSLHDEAESSPHHPRGVVNGYGHSYGDEVINNPYVDSFSYSYPPRSFGEPQINRWYQPGGQPLGQPLHYASNSNVYYMNKSAPEIRTVIQEPPTEATYSHSESYWNSPAGYGNSGYGGNYAYFSWGSPATTSNDRSVNESKEKEAPPPPSPKASGWDFFNPFDVSDNGYLSYYSSGRYGHGSNTSSPDSNELREREGIPDLEEDTENEASNDFLKGKRTEAEVKKRSKASAPHPKAVSMRKISDSNSARTREIVGSSRSVPLHKSEDRSRSVTSWSSDESEKLSLPSRHSGENEKQYLKEILKPLPSPPSQKRTSWVGHSQSVGISLSAEKYSPETYVSKIVDEKSLKKKGVTFEVEDASNQDADSSKCSGVTPLSPHDNRDLREVVAEIRDDFEIASGFGKEVAMMLEVWKLPHQSSFLKVTLSRIICHIAPSVSTQDASSIKSVKLASGTTKLAKSYFEDVDKDLNTKACSHSSTLDKLLAWETKLYKEVKDEERIRVKYEKQCKRLKILDEGGAEATKLDAAQASIRRLRTKLDVSIKAIDGISSRIHELREEELQPQVASLIHGLIRMWKAMLKFHQKQFQAIMESKMRKLKVNTGLQTDLSSRTTTVLERELSLWCGHFSDWIGFQKSYVESLNKWLLLCLQYEIEETSDGPVPYSPGQLGAPPIFVICNDWHQAMEKISEARVAGAMNNFATILRQLGEKQDEEGRQRLKAEYLSKDYEKHLRTPHFDGGKLEHEQDAMSIKTGLLLFPSDNGVLPLDNLKVDLNSTSHRLSEERIKHEDAVNLVHDAVSSSLQSGLVPIFQALESFTSEALKLHEHIRLQHHGKS
ncbi:LOW QUALITY PROTEIN: uncharacterized protein LOC142525345 [Primulina tabacum]|uniref:LOW QUALITY PROTEIN: uncharacterized protein LOC142525345 n=1 Tax=Primulina tabacum TaxID=48773 RepID=UPI003F5AB4E6